VDERDRPIREKIDFNTGVVVLDTRMETRAVRVATEATRVIAVTRGIRYPFWTVLLRLPAPTWRVNAEPHLTS
jgi:hypothetical protein